MYTLNKPFFQILLHLHIIVEPAIFHPIRAHTYPVFDILCFQKSVVEDSVFWNVMMGCWIYVSRHFKEHYASPSNLWGQRKM
jgi:hypothetical protein